MEQQRNADIIQLVNSTRLLNRRRDAHFDRIEEVQLAIRERRKTIIGSYISVEAVVGCGEMTDETIVQTLSTYLADRAVVFWNTSLEHAFDFSRRFFYLSIYAIVSGKVGRESFDDIIQLCETLVRSKDTFIVVLKNLLPENLIGDLFYFVEQFDDMYYHPSFEEAVLGALSVFLGALKDPIDDLSF